MNDQGNEGVRGQSAHARLALPGPMYVLAACGVVATSAYLGAEWMRRPVVGLPAGLWAIGIAYAASYAHSLRSMRRASAPAIPKPELPLAPGVPSSAGWTGLDVGLFTGRIAAGAWDSIRSLGVGLGVSAEKFSPFEASIASWLDRAPSASRPLRIGVDAGPHIFAALKSAPSPNGAATDWILVPPAREDQPTLSRFRLDALLRHRTDGPTTIATPESPEAEASWYDWSAPRPLTYASVFPTRIDPARITLEEADHTDKAELEDLAALARAAAALSRLPARLTASDRLRGRTPVPATPAPAAASEASSPIQAAMLNLIRSVVGRPQNSPPSPARKSAARAVGAWLATTDCWVDPKLRRQGIDAAARILADEPEAQLRAAAVRLSVGDDTGSFQAMDSAIQILRARSNETVIDHVAFLQSELECGLPGPMTLGRVAAGVCLVCATTTASHVPYIRADFMDDARYSAWLVGRDQDRAALMQVFRHLEQRAAPEVRREAA